MILDIWEDKMLDYMTVINAISTFWKICILSFNIFFMKHEVSKTDSAQRLLLAESPAKTDILILT